jgi:hypothetical protein
MERSALHGGWCWLRWMWLTMLSCMNWRICAYGIIRGNFGK